MARSEGPLRQARREALLVAVVALAASASCAPPVGAPGAASPASAREPDDGYRAPRVGTPTWRNPGGDASDPERAAIARLVAEPFAARLDRSGSFSVQLADELHWTATHIAGLDARQAYQFGEDRHAASAVWYFPAKGGDAPEACLERFLDEHRTKARIFGVALASDVRVALAGRDAAARKLDADLNLPLHVGSWVGGLVATRSWPGTCLVQGFAVIATDHPELASRAVDRWIQLGAPGIAWTADLASAPPFDPGR